MAKNETTKLEKLFSIFALALLSVAAFAGVMSLISGDPVVRYTVAGILIFFAAKELAINVLK